MRIEITGGTGLMGRELQKIMSGHYLSHQEIEIRDTESVKQLSGAGLVVHLAAIVDVNGAERDKQLAYDTNVLGSRNVSRHAPTLYISSDYVFDGERGNYSEEDYPNPINFYGLTKLLGEKEVLANGGKVLRLSFKPRPYKHPKVPREMYFSGGYVDEMAQEIKKAVDHFKELSPITHVGIKRISLIELARQTREIEEISINDVSTRIPKDVSFDLTLWRKIWKD